MTVIDIFLLALIIVAIVLCVYLVLTLRKVTETVQRVESDIHELSKSTVPLLENLNEETKKIVYITNEAEKHVDDINGAIIHFKEKVDDFKSGFAHSMNPDNPVQSMIRTISGIVKGISAFWHKFSN